MTNAFRDRDDQVPDDTSPSVLVRRLRPAEDESIAALALKALSRKRVPEAAAQALRVLGNPRFPISVRSIAAVELGKAARPENESALLRAVDTADASVLKHVLNSIGRIGGEESLERLDALELPRQTPAGKALDFARTLVAYRIGSTRFLVPPPPAAELRPPSPEEALPIHFRSLERTQLQPTMAVLQREIPGTPLSERTGAAFSCGNSDYRIVLTADIEAEGGTQLLARPSIVGAVLKDRVCSGHFSLDAYLLSSPKDERSSSVYGMRPSGVMVLAGVAGFDGRNLNFELVATRSPHYQKVRLSGDFTRSGRLRVSEAELGRDMADERPRREPRLRSLVQTESP